MNVAFAVAGLFALAATAGHSILGERWILSKLEPANLPDLRFLGRGSGLTVIRATWHLLSVAFASAAVVLLWLAFAPADEAARAAGRAVAVPFFGFVLLIFATAIRKPKALRHRAWVLFLGTAILAWWGGP